MANLVEPIYLASPTWLQQVDVPMVAFDGHNALLVPPGDPEAMAVTIRRVLTEPGLAGRLSTNARTAARAWEWDLILPRWEKLLQKVAEDSHE